MLGIHPPFYHNSISNVVNIRSFFISSVSKSSLKGPCKVSRLQNILTLAIVKEDLMTIVREIYKNFIITVCVIQ